MTNFFTRKMFLGSFQKNKLGKTVTLFKETALSTLTFYKEKNTVVAKSVNSLWKFHVFNFDCCRLYWFSLPYKCLYIHWKEFNVKFNNGNKTIISVLQGELTIDDTAVNYLKSLDLNWREKNFSRRWVRLFIQNTFYAYG